MSTPAQRAIDPGHDMGDLVQDTLRRRAMYAQMLGMSGGGGLDISGAIRAKNEGTQANLNSLLQSFGRQGKPMRHLGMRGEDITHGRTSMTPGLDAWERMNPNAGRFGRTRDQEAQMQQPAAQPGSGLDPRVVAFLNRSYEASLQPPEPAPATSYTPAGPPAPAQPQQRPAADNMMNWLGSAGATGANMMSSQGKPLTPTSAPPQPQVPQIPVQGPPVQAGSSAFPYAQYPTAGPANDPYNAYRGIPEGSAFGGAGVPSPIAPSTMGPFGPNVGPELSPLNMNDEQYDLFLDDQFDSLPSQRSAQTNYDAAIGNAYSMGDDAGASVGVDPLQNYTDPFYDLGMGAQAAFYDAASTLPPVHNALWVNDMAGMGIDIMQGLYNRGLQNIDSLKRGLTGQDPRQKKDNSFVW